MAILTEDEKADLRTVRLPSELIIGGVDRRADFEKFVAELVSDWEAHGFISEPKAGYGFATTGVIPESALMDFDIEDPRAYIASAFTVGDVPERYMWNAVRKIYELLRLVQEGHEIDSTLDALQDHPELLRPAIVGFNDEDGSVPWGPFSWGGAVLFARDGMAILVAFSVWKQEEDDAVSREAAHWLLNEA